MILWLREKKLGLKGILSLWKIWHVWNLKRSVRALYDCLLKILFQWSKMWTYNPTKIQGTDQT